MPVTFDTVRKIALSLDHVEEGTSYGTPGFKVRGALFVRLREDNDTLVLRTDLEQRDALIAGDPDLYFITDHYLNYPWVLVRMSRISAGELRDLLRMAHRLAAASQRNGKGSTRRRAR
jgi:hypothetical protein